VRFRARLRLNRFALRATAAVCVAGAYLLLLAWPAGQAEAASRSSSAHAGTAPVPPSGVCASGVGFVNGSFEEPATGGYYAFPQAKVPGWSSTTSDPRVEIWHTGYLGVPSADGDQHAEVNANQVGELYQDFQVTPGKPLFYRVYHRGRDGPDTMRIELGPGGPNLSYPPDFTREVTTGADGWQEVTGYVAPPAQTTERIGFVAVKSSSGSLVGGNLIDAVAVWQSNCTVSVSQRVEPSSDGGSFDLLVNGVVASPAAGDGAAPVKVPVPVDSITVSEHAAAGTTLSDYTSTITCVDSQSGATVASGDGTSLTVAYNRPRDVACRFANDRIPAITAADDSYSVRQGSTLEVAAPGVLGNDKPTKAGAQPTAGATTVTSPAHGSLSLRSNGSFAYKPNAKFSGTDSFAYQIVDGTTSSTIATVTITVDPLIAPLAVDDSYTTGQEQTLTVPAPGLLQNDKLGSGSKLTAVTVSQPGHGTVTLSGNGSFTYTPASGYSGPDSFSYKANDGLSSSAPATVSISITAEVPPTSVDDAYATDENATLTVARPGVLLNDAAGSGSPLTAVSAGKPAHGTLQLTSDGSFTYTPAKGYVGSDSFSYESSDGISDSTPATVTITDRKVDQPPVAHDDTYTTSQDKPLSVSAPGVLENDSDPDNDTLVVGTPRPLAGPAHGTLALHENGSFVYTPDPGFNGSDAFTYTAADGDDTSHTATATITVNAAEPLPTPNGVGNDGGSGNTGPAGGKTQTTGAIDQFDVPTVIIVPANAPSADTVSATMHEEKLSACSLTVATTDSHYTLIADGRSTAPANGSRRLLTPLRLRPAGARLLGRHFGGAPAFVSAECTTTANGRVTGHVVYVKRTLIISEIEHIVTHRDRSFPTPRP
jgi:Big-like domain-containing protein/prealbumin domain-containing protein